MLVYFKMRQKLKYHLKIFRFHWEDTKLEEISRETSIPLNVVLPKWSFTNYFTLLCSSKSTHAKLVSEEILQSRSMKVATNFGWYFLWDCKASSTRRSEYHLTTFFRCSAFIVFRLYCLFLGDLGDLICLNTNKFQAYFFHGKTFTCPFYTKY